VKAFECQSKVWSFPKAISLCQSRHRFQTLIRDKKLRLTGLIAPADSTPWECPRTASMVAGEWR
jgi:hypothetical protein